MPGSLVPALISKPGPGWREPGQGEHRQEDVGVPGSPGPDPGSDPARPRPWPTGSTLPASRITVAIGSRSREDREPLLRSGSTGASAALLRPLLPGLGPFRPRLP